MTDKQRMFIAEYLVDYNATEAAIRAGYSENGAAVQGHKLLRNANIRDSIRKHLDDALADTKLSLKNDVIDELYAIAKGEPDVRERDGQVLEVNRRDKLKALELLGKHMTMFTDRVEHAGDKKNPIQISISEIMNEPEVK